MASPHYTAEQMNAFRRDALAYVNEARKLFSKALGALQEAQTVQDVVTLTERKMIAKSNPSFGKAYVNEMLLREVLDKLNAINFES